MQGKKTKRTKVLVQCLSLILTLTLMSNAAGISRPLAAYSEESRGEAEEIYESGEEEPADGEAEKRTYLLEDTFTVPEYGNVPDGCSVVPIVIFPDGTAVSRESVILDQTGLYVLRYEFYKDGKVSGREESTFEVYIPNYETSGESSAVWTEDGLNVSLKEGDKFTLNRAISKTVFQTGENFINLDITPKTKDVIDFCRLKFKLIDTLDENNYVQIYVRNSNDSLTQVDPEPFKSSSYGLAGAAGQVVSGYEASIDFIHRNNDWGAPLSLSFWGKDEQTTLKVSVNSTNGEVYANGARIIDLDSSDFFSSSWNGFKGDVILEITADNYLTTEANFRINEIPGVDLSEPLYKYEEKPTVDVETDGMIPAALKNHAYPLFPATATDAEGDPCKVTARVYYNYENESARQDIDVSGGKFTASRTGEYTIVYTAKDRYGNVAEKLIAVECYDSLKDVRVSATVSGRTYSGFAGERIGVGGIIASGGSGKLNCSVYAVSKSESIEVKDGWFVPNFAETYAIVYTAEDYIGRTATYVYNVDVTYSDKPVFETPADLPECYISGYTYELPVVKAHRYTAEGKRETPVDVKLTIDGQPCLISEGKAEIPDVVSEKNAVLTYSSEGVETSFQIKILPGKKEDGSVDFTSFVKAYGGVTISQETRALKFSAEEDGSAEYRRNLVYENMTLSFSLPELLEGCRSLDIVLTDSQNAADSVRFSLRNNGGQAEVSINDGAYRTYSDTFTPEFELRFTGGNVLIYNSSYAISDFESGAAFDGFPSGLVNVSVQFKGVESNTSFELESINRQSFRANATDNVAPQIALLEDSSVLQELGAVVSVPKAVSSDVLNPQVDFRVSVKGPDGNYVTDLDGRQLKDAPAAGDYKIRLETYGEYVVEYISVDESNGRMTTRIVHFLVERKIIPVLNFDFEIQETAAVGDTVLVSSASVDGAEEGTNYTLERYLILPDRKMINFEENYYDSFVAAEAGIYTVRYYIVDESGNYNVYDFTVTAS